MQQRRVITRKLQNFLAKNPNVSEKVEMGNTPLHWAIVSGGISTVRQLLNAGADVNVMNNSKYSPIRNAIVFGQDEILKALLEHNAKNNAQTPGEETLLLLLDDVYDEEKKEVFRQILLSHGADANSKDANGDTPKILPESKKTDEDHAETESSSSRLFHPSRWTTTEKIAGGVAAAGLDAALAYMVWCRWKKRHTVAKPFKKNTQPKIATSTKPASPAA